MAFEWKSHKDIFKGPGIYQLAVVGAGGRPRVEELVAECPDVSRPFYRSLTKRVPAVNETGEIAMVRLSPFGKAVSADINALKERYKGNITLCRKILMDNHLHVVVWVHGNIGKSILEVAHGFQQGITHIAHEMGVWPMPQAAIQVGMTLGAYNAPAAEALPYHILEKPYVRTLSRAGQLDKMCDYVVLNPYRKYMRRLHPDLFTMHKHTEVQGLRFKSMGNHWLLDWPEKQIVQCSRSISEEDLLRQLKQALWNAERGAITYTAAISKGEQTIARGIREAGWPLVVLLLGGFPPEGNENERYY